MTRAGRTGDGATGKPPGSSPAFPPSEASTHSPPVAGPPSTAMQALRRARRAWARTQAQLEFPLTDAEGGASGPVLRT